jgi:hypothetical protein
LSLYTLDVFFGSFHRHDSSILSRDFETTLDHMNISTDCLWIDKKYSLCSRFINIKNEKSLYPWYQRLWVYLWLAPWHPRVSVLICYFECWASLTSLNSRTPLLGGIWCCE